MSETRIRGSSDPNGSWKMIWIFERIRWSCRPANRSKRSPAKIVSPPITA
jgi:hypothetical protein